MMVIFLVQITQSISYRIPVGYCSFKHSLFWIFNEHTSKIEAMGKDYFKKEFFTKMLILQSVLDVIVCNALAIRNAGLQNNAYHMHALFKMHYIKIVHIHRALLVLCSRCSHEIE